MLGSGDAIESVRKKIRLLTGFRTIVGRFHTVHSAKNA